MLDAVTPLLGNDWNVLNWVKEETSPLTRKPPTTVPDDSVHTPDGDISAEVPDKPDGGDNNAGQNDDNNVSDNSKVDGSVEIVDGDTASQTNVKSSNEKHGEYISEEGETTEENIDVNFVEEKHESEVIEKSEVIEESEVGEISEPKRMLAKRSPRKARTIIASKKVSKRINQSITVE